MYCIIIYYSKKVFLLLFVYVNRVYYHFIYPQFLRSFIQRYHFLLILKEHFKINSILHELVLFLEVIQSAQSAHIFISFISLCNIFIQNISVELLFIAYEMSTPFNSGYIERGIFQVGFILTKSAIRFIHV